MMKSFLGLLLVGILPTSLWASDLKPFFQSFEGKWWGNGALVYADRDGKLKEAPLKTEFTITEGDESIGDPEQTSRWIASSWLTSNQISTQNTVSFLVRGNHLWIKQDDRIDPAHVIESTPWSLTYETQRLDIYTGRVYSFTFQTEVDLSGHKLWQHNTIELNGVVIWDEAFEARN